jgi:hypothetical protein
MTVHQTGTTSDAPQRPRVHAPVTARSHSSRAEPSNTWGEVAMLHEPTRHLHAHPFDAVDLLLRQDEIAHPARTHMTARSSQAQKILTTFPPAPSEGDPTGTFEGPPSRASPARSATTYTSNHGHRAQSSTCDTPQQYNEQHDGRHSKTPTGTRTPRPTRCRKTTTSGKPTQAPHPPRLTHQPTNNHQTRETPHPNLHPLPGMRENAPHTTNPVEQRTHPRQTPNTDSLPSNWNKQRDNKQKLPTPACDAICSDPAPTQHPTSRNTQF